MNKCGITCLHQLGSQSLSGGQRVWFLRHREEIGNKKAVCLLDVAGWEALRNPRFYELHPPQGSQEASSPTGGSPGAPEVSRGAQPRSPVSGL